VIAAPIIQGLNLYAVKRRLPSGEPVDLVAAIDREWERLGLADKARGKRIAIGIGSRGVAGIAIIARELVSLVRRSGGEPFIVPAMGSHGGATPQGQLGVLESLGITESSVGCPLRATMDTVTLGQTASGLPVYFDRFVAEADGLIIANRVKIHTDFHGATESGLLKMTAIGLGKERGASLVHSYGVRGLRDFIPEIAQAALEKINLLAGFATVEDGYHRLVHLEAFRAGEIAAGERRLLDMARSLSPSLPVDDIDVLIVDQIGKEISGAGMDTNVIGRWFIEGEPEPDRPRIKAIVVLDLTDATHGNATGIGLADFTVRRVMDKIDFALTTKNIFTSGFLQRGRIPLVFETDAEAIDAALFHVFRANPQARPNARVMRIRNTLELEELWITPNLIDEVKAAPGFISVEPAEQETRTTSAVK
jgi:Lactate racemase N-terminal domain